ncbi:MAG: hypothetical protein ACTSUB_04345 [Candidatus Thorarchaeota archaeon]
MFDIRRITEEPTNAREKINAPAPNDHEISSIDNEMVWNAFALNPLEYALFVNGSVYTSGTWDGGNIILNMDGLSAGYHQLQLFVFHISEYSFDAGSSVTVTDLTVPSWIIGPTYQEIHEGETLSVQFSAEDESGISGWTVNDTVNFHINSTGLLTNLTSLTDGDYNLNISAVDAFGNILSHTIRIRVLYVPPVTTTPPPAPLDETTMMLLLGGGGLGVIIILVIVLRKRGG